MHQNDDYSCGAISVFMVVSALSGFPSTLSEIKNHQKALLMLLKTNPETGTYQNDMVRALKTYSRYRNPKKPYKIVVRSFAKKPPTRKLLEEYLNKGYIGVGCVDVNNHWLVIRGIKGNRVYVADPDRNGVRQCLIDICLSRLHKGSIVFVKAG